MNPREKRLAIIVGVFAGCFAIYQGVNTLFLSSIRNAEADIANLEKDMAKLRVKKLEKMKLEKEWRDDAARTFSFSETIAKDMLQREIKQIALKHGFDSPNVKTAMGMRIAIKSQIKTPAVAVTLIGDYARTMAFLQDIYHTPFLCQVTSLSISPLGPRYGRNNVKLDITVETPVLPQTFKKVEFASAPTTMPSDPVQPQEPYREDLAPDSYLAILENRNILREFIPAPTNVVMIDNQDRKLVGVKAQFFFDGKVETQLQKGVEGNKQQQIEGKGDVVELTVAYADGHTVGPVRHEFKSGGPWAYKVGSHTPEPPPDEIHLAVNNPNPEEVLLKIVVTTNDNKQLAPPTMLIEPNQTIDIGEWQAKQIQYTVTYKSKKPGPTGQYMPSKELQTLVVPPEPPELVIDTTQPRPEDPPADDQYTVSGLWTYRDVQEMIVTSAAGRKIITLRNEGAVDGGNLIAVHPLGGIIYMPATGNYYIYPLGKTFGKRHLLDTRTEEGLAAAIDEWSRLKPLASAQATMAGE